MKPYMSTASKYVSWKAFIEKDLRQQTILTKLALFHISDNLVSVACTPSKYPSGSHFYQLSVSKSRKRHNQNQCLFITQRSQYPVKSSCSNPLYSLISAPAQSLHNKLAAISFLSNTFIADGVLPDDIP
jgi:hypothetical protein